MAITPEQMQSVLDHFRVRDALGGLNVSDEQAQFLVEAIAEGIELFASPFTFPSVKDVARMGEMAPAGDSHMRLLIEDDGDVCVSIYEADGPGAARIAGIQFCAPGAGGGQSPHTRRALLDLIRAMAQDNADLPSRAWPPKG